MKRVVCGLLLASVACGGSPTGPSTATPLSRSIETKAFLFRYADGDRVDAGWQQAYHEWAVAALQVSVTRQIVYNKYTSRTHMGDLTGSYTTNAYADPATFEIHTLWPVDNHEVVHLYSSLFGRPVALWSEGLAVALQVNPVTGDMVARWSGTSVDDLARQFRASDRLVPIASLLSTGDFRRFDPNVTYPEAGSFVRYVLNEHGLEALKLLFGMGQPTDSAAVVRGQFEAVYRRPVEQVERDWLDMLARP